MSRNNQLALNLQRLLVERNMKAIELSEKTGLNCGQLSRILNGKSYPSIASLNRLAAALDVTPGTLLDGKAPDLTMIPEEPIADQSVEVALRSFRVLSKQDKRHLAWLIERFAQKNADPDLIEVGLD